MRAGSYNFFYTIIVEGLDILVGHHLEHKFISCSSCRITGTHFFFSKNGKADAHLIQYGGKSLRDLLRPLVKTTSTTNPKKNLGTFTSSHKFCHASYFHIAILNERVQCQ